MIRAVQTPRSRATPPHSRGTTPDGYCQVLNKIVDDTLTSDFWTITLPNELASSASKSPALLAYIAALNVLDADALLSTVKIRSRLDPAVTAKKGIERHHIFPKGYLKTLGIVDVKQVNQIANMALVEWADNIKISDAAPVVYWPQQVATKSNHSLTPDRLHQQTYWHALPDGWQTMTYLQFLGARRVLMAQVVRDAYSRLADTAYQPIYLVPQALSLESTSSSGTFYGVKVSDLIDADLLSVGAVLTAGQDECDAVAIVLPDGRIKVDDDSYETPSAAAATVKGGPANGWKFWLADTPDGQHTLAALRDQWLTQKNLQASND